ncbi:MAG: Hsp20/alpha crystallin family protein [Halobacteriaceae archaeon]
MVPYHPRHEVELFRDEGEFVVYVDLPADDVDVDLRWRDGDLSVIVEHEDPETGRNRIRQRHVGFHRPVRRDDISATIEEGVLVVHLPIDESADHSGTYIDVA